MRWAAVALAPEIGLNRMGEPVIGEAQTMPPGLVYASDATPGICRLRKGKGFTYRQVDGMRVSDARQLERIRRLAIPPAYAAVWICPSARGHIQATGRDARGRKQYLYHPQWRQARDETKFDHMADFGGALPRIRASVTRDLEALAGAQVQHRTVVAAIVHLLDTTLMRVGNDEYARSNGSFGLTTLRKRHVAVSGSRLRLRFRGKSGIAHEVRLEDKRIARVVKRCQILPGQELFQYLDQDGAIHSVGSADVNEYLQAASDGAFTAKDFRTWHGSVHALQLWYELGAGGNSDPGKGIVNQLLAEVASRLGNTVAVCRKSYVHPRVLALLTGTAPAHWLAPDRRPPRKSGLSAAERRFLKLLYAPA
ncbi:DNA topoisomerase IB [Collimonas pratensis]|nr:DNA topoisomerase IB [Collimonas pratensis]